MHGPLSQLMAETERRTISWAGRHPKRTLYSLTSFGAWTHELRRSACCATHRADHATLALAPSARWLLDYLLGYGPLGSMQMDRVLICRLPHHHPSRWH